MESERKSRFPTSDQLRAELIERWEKLEHRGAISGNTDQIVVSGLAQVLGTVELIDAIKANAKAQNDLDRRMVRLANVGTALTAKHSNAAVIK